MRVILERFVKNPTTGATIVSVLKFECNPGQLAFGPGTVAQLKALYPGWFLRVEGGYHGVQA